MPKLRGEANGRFGKESECSTEQGSTFIKGKMGASEEIRVDLGAAARDARALSEVVHRSRLRGQSLVQVGENCNIPTPMYEFQEFLNIL